MGATPPPIPLADLPVTHMRAAHLTMLRATYRAALTEAHWQELRTSLPEATRRLLDAEIDPGGWLPIVHTQALRDAFHRVGFISPFVTRGRLTAEAFAESEGGRALLAGRDPVATVAVLDLVLAELQKGGRLMVEEARPGRARWTFWGILPFPEYGRDFGRAFFERLLQLQGAGAARVTYLPPEGDDYHHRFVADW
jgi:hypothetical protein